MNVFHLLIITSVLPLIINKLIHNQYLQILVSIILFSILLKHEVLFFLIPFVSVLIGNRHKNKLLFLYTTAFIILIKTDLFFLILFESIGLNYEPFEICAKFIIGLFLINHLVLIKIKPDIKKIDLIIESFKITNIFFPLKKNKNQRQIVQLNLIKLISVILIFKLLFAESFNYWSEYAFEGFSMNFVQIWISLICNSFYYFFEILSFLLLSITICYSFGYDVSLEHTIIKLKRFMFSNKILNFPFFIFLLILLLFDNNYLFFISSLSLVIISKLTISKSKKISIKKIIFFSFSFLILPIMLRVDNLSELVKILKEMINIKSIFIYYNELYILWPLKINWFTFLTITVVSMIFYNYRNILILLKENKLIPYLFVTISIAISLYLFDSSIDFTFIN